MAPPEQAAADCLRETVNVSKQIRQIYSVRKYISGCIGLGLGINCEWEMLMVQCVLVG